MSYLPLAETGIDELQYYTTHAVTYFCNFTTSKDYIYIVYIFRYEYMLGNRLYIYYFARLPLIQETIVRSEHRGDQVLTSVNVLCLQAKAIWLDAILACG